MSVSDARAWCSNNGIVGERSDGTGIHGTGVSPALVGRDVELGRVREALENAIAGDGGVLVLIGEAGIGKSRLTQAAAADGAKRGLAVLQGRAVQAATSAAYRPLAEALCSAVRSGVAPVPSTVGPFRSTLAHLIPEWRGDDHGPLDESHVAVAEAVLRFLRATASERGALVVLEDLQWADAETSIIVDYLADNLATESVLCVVTVRDDLAGMALAQALRSRRAGSVLPLGPLDRPQVSVMAAACLRANDLPEEVLAFAARAEGIPFMVEELLAAAVSTGALVEQGGAWRVAEPLEGVVPISFADSMRRRLRELGPQAEQVVMSAAVLGRRFDWSLLPRITGLADDAVLNALHDAVEARIVSVDAADGTFGFRHALTRDAVLAVFFPAELEAVAHRAVEAVEAAHPDLSDEEAELAADLAVRAGQYRRAAMLLLDSARRASRQGALATAEAALERARALLPEGDSAALDVDEALLDVLATAGKQARAVEVGSGLLDALGGDGQWARRRSGIHLRLARAAVAATRWDAAQNHMEAARREAEAVSAEDLVARVVVVAAQIAIVRDPAAAPSLASAALKFAERAGIPEVACEALEVLGRAQRPDDLDAAEETFARALAVAETAGLSVWRARALHELGAIDMLRGRSVRRLEEARELALENGAVATAAVVDVQIAAALIISDDPEGGGDAARRAAELARRYRFDQILAAAVALEGYEHARLRRREELRRCLDEASSLAAGVPDIEVKTSTARAFAALVEEDRASARHHLCAGLRAAARGGDYSAVPAIGFLALFRQVDGPDDEAPEVEIPERSVHFLASAYLRYAEAVAAGRAGNPQAALALIEVADDILANHAWCRHLARRLVAEAAVAEGWGDPVPLLREALEFFDDRGDDPIASACRSLLRRAGAKVPRRREDPRVPSDLRALGITARELEVLQLLAQGMANNEIGVRLYLSPRTVERHVASLAVKTGAERRSAVVAFAARTLGTDTPPR